MTSPEQPPIVGQLATDPSVLTALIGEWEAAASAVTPVADPTVAQSTEEAYADGLAEAYREAAAELRAATAPQGAVPDRREAAPREQDRPDRLAEIKQRAERAIRGPWDAEYDSCDCGDGYGCSHGSWIAYVRLLEPKEPMRPGQPTQDWQYCYSEIGDFPVDTGEFIVHSRADVDYLIAEVERLRAALADRGPLITPEQPPEPLITLTSEDGAR